MSQVKVYVFSFLFIVLCPILVFGQMHNTERPSGVEGCGEDNGLLLDLWEGQFFEGYTYTEQGLSVEQYIERSIKKLEAASPLIMPYVKEALNFVRNPQNHILIPSQVAIHPPKDRRSAIFLHSCLSGATVFQKKSEKLYIDRDKIARLSPLNEAALWMHNAFSFRLNRKNSVDTLVEDHEVTVRLLTACLFSTEKNCLEAPDAFTYLPEKNLYKCESSQVEVFVWNDPLSDSIYAIDQERYLVTKFRSVRTNPYPELPRKPITASLKYMVGETNKKPEPIELSASDFFSWTSIEGTLFDDSSYVKLVPSQKKRNEMIVTQRYWDFNTGKWKIDEHAMPCKRVK